MEVRVESDWKIRVGCPKCQWHCSEFDSHFIDCCPKCGTYKPKSVFNFKWWTETMRVVSVPLGKRWWHGRESYWQIRRADGNHIRLKDAA